MCDVVEGSTVGEMERKLPERVYVLRHANNKQCSRPSAASVTP